MMVVIQTRWLQDWDQFPHKGQGGVALAEGEDIHNIAGLEREQFEAGNIWWAVLQSEC